MIHCQCCLQVCNADAEHNKVAMWDPLLSRTNRIWADDTSLWSLFCFCWLGMWSRANWVKRRSKPKVCGRSFANSNQVWEELHITFVIHCILWVPHQSQKSDKVPISFLGGATVASVIWCQTSGATSALWFHNRCSFHLMSQKTSHKQGKEEAFSSMQKWAQATECWWRASGQSLLQPWIPSSLDTPSVQCNAFLTDWQAVTAAVEAKLGTEWKAFLDQWEKQNKIVAWSQIENNEKLQDQVQGCSKESIKFTGWKESSERTGLRFLVSNIRKEADRQDSPAWSWCKLCQEALGTGNLQGQWVTNLDPELMDIRSEWVVVRCCG